MVPTPDDPGDGHPYPESWEASSRPAHVDLEQPERIAGQPSSSDVRIREQVAQRFQEHATLDPSIIALSVMDGEVSLSGTCRSAEEPALAEAVARSVDGVRAVHNQMTTAATPPD